MDHADQLAGGGEDGLLVALPRPEGAEVAAELAVLGSGGCVRAFDEDPPERRIALPGTRYADQFQNRFFWHAGSSPDAHQIRDPRMERAISYALELQGSLRTLARIEEFLLDLMTRVADYDAALPNDAPKWLAAACVAARSLSVFRKARPDLWRRQGADMSTHAAKLDTISVCRPLKS